MCFRPREPYEEAEEAGSIGKSSFASVRACGGREASGQIDGGHYSEVLGRRTVRVHSFVTPRVARDCRMDTMEGGRLVRMEAGRPTLDILNQNLRFNTIPHSRLRSVSVS